jgi:putative ABC transport system substrate-binding protein
LAEAGWIIGRNARIDYRWYQGNAEAARAYAAELVALTPDIIHASGTQGTIALKQLTCTVPIGLRGWPIRSVLASLTAWPDRVAT